MRAPRSPIALGLACLSLLAAPLAQSDDELVNTVKDLAYGEVLFHFYKGDYFTALTRLLAGLERDELPSHARDADLLMGGLYLSYGQHRLAGQIFERVLEGAVDAQTSDRAWFFLARIWYQRGYFEDAAAALARVHGELPPELEADHRMLHAQVLMELGRFDEALASLESWRAPSDRWIGYAKYNIGVALVRLGRIEDGARVLSEVGTLEPEDPDLEALRDKANVALGYAWLQAERPLEAKPSLQRVRLNGPYSNKALLGVGWSDVERGDYQAALAPWIELRNRDLLDAAVQESLLAVPYAFSQLGAQKQAADYYVDAIAAFELEIARLDETIASVRGGLLIDELLRRDAAEEAGWYWRLDAIPESDESRYLYELMATHRFQEGLRTYRDLDFLTANLDAWAESLSIFNDILDTRQRAYEQRLPVVEASLSGMDPDEMARRRLQLESRLLEIERSEDVVALGTVEQQRLWRELAEMEPKLALIEGDARAAQLRDKQRFLKGRLLWDLRRDYRARLWAQQKSLRELDREIKEARSRHGDVETARVQWPQQFAEQTTRIAALRPRVERLQASARATLSAQRAFLQGIAIEELTAQRGRLDTYLVQARFALAAIYDRASASTGAPRADAVVAEERR